MLKKRCLNKRGFAIQFNWLFVLIGGAIILAFFFSLITNQASEGEKRTAQRSTQELDALLKVSLASGDTQKTLLFDRKILFYCDEISEYYVRGSVKPSRYDYNAIFSPSELESKELIIQTLAFEAPFRVMPLVYVTNKDIEYVFVGSSALLNMVYDFMPDDTLKKSLVVPSNIANYPDNNYDRTVFVLNITDAGGLGSITLNKFDNSDGRVYAVVINATEDSAYGYGNISFFRYDGSNFVPDGSVLFLGSELVLGGVISHDKTIYECNLRKVLRRLELLSRLHINRTVYYYYNAHEECEDYYNNANARGFIEDIKGYAAEKDELSVDDFDNALTAINELRSLNTYIIRRTSCPPIY